MSRGRKKKPVSPIYVAAILWLLISFWRPITGLLRLFGTAVIVVAAFLIIRSIVSPKAKKETETDSAGSGAQTASSAGAAQSRSGPARSGQTAQAARTAAEAPKPRPKPSYPPEVQAVVDEGEQAHRELTRLYASIPDLSVKRKIQELIDVSDKIVADAVEDPSDVPQIKKFLDYYLPTTIKLLNAYDRMGAQGIQGENITKSMESINEMLDTAIDAYKKLLDSLFANQAMDIETDIEVMNTMLRREGLSGGGSAFQFE